MNLKNIFFLSALFLLVSVAVCCRVARSEDVADGRPVITVTLPVEKYFADRLVGDDVEINVMIPNQVGHSGYTPLPSQMLRLSSCDSYIAIGELDFEQNWRERIMDQNKGMKWCRLDKGINLLVSEHHHHDGDDGEDDEADEAEEHHHHCGMDPHYWMSPERACRMLENLAEIMKGLLPGNEVKIDSMQDILKAELYGYRNRLDSIAQKKIAFMIYHPSLSYLAKDFGMQQISIENDGKLPTAAWLAENIEVAKRNGVKVVFAQKGFDEEKVAMAANETGAKLFYIQPEQYDYAETMQTVIKALADAEYED